MIWKIKMQTRVQGCPFHGFPLFFIVLFLVVKFDIVQKWKTFCELMTLLNAFLFTILFFSTSSTWLDFKIHTRLLLEETHF